MADAAVPGEDPVTGQPSLEDRRVSGSARFPVARVPSAAGIVAGVAIIAVCVLLALISDTLPVFILGLIIAFVLDPLVTWLEKHRVPRGLATLLSMALVAVVLGMLAVVFVDTVVTQATAFIATLPEAFAHLEEWVASLNLNAAVEEDVLAWLASVEQAAASMDATSLLAPALQGLFAILGAFFTLLVLPFFLFYVLAGRPVIAHQVRETLPVPWRDDVLAVIDITLNSFGTYVRAEAVVMTILGAMVWLGIMGLSILVDPAFADFALLLAIIAAFSELIPNFGPWIAAIPAVLFALTISPAAVVATIILYIVLMFIEGQVLVPKIEGGAFSLHPALVLFIVVAGIAIMGLLGAILALPVTAAAWRIARYTFRRASGRPPAEALAYGADEPGREVADASPAGTEPAPATQPAPAAGPAP